MKIMPDILNPKNFTITEISDIELRNLLEGIQNRSYHPKSPWTKDTIRLFEQALSEHRSFLSKIWT